MALADEMRRLTQRLGEDHDGRTAAVVDIRTTVARELSEFRTDRQAEAEAQRRQLRVYGRGLRVYMARARGDTAAVLAGLGAAREKLSSEQQHKLAGDIVALRQGTGALLDEWNSIRRAMAQGQQARLSAHVVALRKDATALRDRLEVASQAMSDEQRLALGRYMSDVRGRVNQLLDDADQAMATRRAARQSMAKEQCQQLAEENQSLRGEVGAFRTQIGVDQAEARQVWARYSKLMRQHGVRKPQATVQAPEPPAQEKKAESSTHVAEPVAPEPPTHVTEPTPAEPGAMDDFRVIEGVGPAMERRLHKAGIYRFAQLAAMTTEELRRAVAAEPFVRVESWIERARELAEQK
jgi:predicted flap endonuclease-1-like 5' DNA nuclease